MIIEITCKGCGKSLQLTHPLRRYHNNACKMKAYRKRVFIKNLTAQKPLRMP